MIFLHATTVLLIKLILTTKNSRFEASARNQQKQLIQQSRKCKVPKSINVTIFVPYYLSSRPEVFY